MKKVLLVLVAIVFASTLSLFAQEEMQDVLYLTNGIIHKGKIINKTDKHVTIQTYKGTYKISKFNIEKTTQEKTNSNISNDQLKIMPYRNPGIATFMSLIIPGGGQFYNNQSGKGIGFFIWGASSASLLTYSLLGGFEDNNENIAIISGISYLACWIFSMVDANETAYKINAGYLASFNLGNNKYLSFSPDYNVLNINNQTKQTIGINASISF